MKIVELILEENELFGGIDAVSLVEFPAIEENFVTLKRAAKHKMTLAKLDGERRLAIGPALIPDKMIPRFDAETNEEYNIFFSKGTVRKAAYQFLKASRQGNATLEHEVAFKGATVVESWIVDGLHDKAVHLGYDVPRGTWMIAMHVENDEVWELAKEGKVKGFSIEGWFTNALEMSHQFSEEDLLAFIQKAVEEDPMVARELENMINWNAMEKVAEMVRTDPAFADKVKELIAQATGKE